ncbi:PREDICTED: von Willebrand factor A domain-containing protein 7-like isoform X2 [Branchiostoma belcheri]|uniref:von Willebrand factor A domain-containing protein 7-like isoform X2 n=1 Tax=Branchiostoma belcheri TaxID=7741 RepID=A0A6P4XVP8_BRABE|nr:PREDICTED: von Willebrand factor A domain-containing protein 7-like isoform X2 [Branchiostoma belcheri]
MAIFASVKKVFLVMILAQTAVSFRPNRFSAFYGLDYTHEDITKTAALKVVAKFLEENPEEGRAVTPGQLQNLDPLTASSIFSSYYGGPVSAKNFDDAIGDITKANADIDQHDLWTSSVHFNAEQFQTALTRLRNIRSTIIGTLQKADLTDLDVSAARINTGSYLHTLQDFYSNTNWVENNGAVIYEDLGMPDRPNPAVAPPLMNTCSSTDCPPGGPSGGPRTTCENNLIVPEGVLTSGYRSDQDVDKPSVDHAWLGKCSHGGSHDATRSLTATGGINKESLDRAESPHHFLHETAARAAINATEHFFYAAGSGLKDQVGVDVFRRFFNLASGTSLCIVMDDTGSMSNDIAAAKSVSIEIIQRAVANPFDKPYNYVLVPFNDPMSDAGPMTITRDSTVYTAAINALNAHGGGDCPELSMTGLELALQNTLPKSKIYLFTDADPKDSDKMPDVLSLLRQKKSTITFLLTGSCSRKRRDLHGRLKRAVSGNPYDVIAEESGGKVFDITKDEVAEVSEVIALEVNGAPVTVMIKSVSESGPRDHEIAVDDTLLEMVITLTGSTATPVFQLYTPSGATQVFGTADAQVVIETDRYKVLKLTSPAAGTWVLRLADSQGYDIEVTGKSVLDFSTEFLDPGTGFLIDGRPVAGSEYRLVVSGRGLENVGNVTSATLLDQSGAVLSRIYLHTSSGRGEPVYTATILPPSQPFRISVEGIDQRNNTFTRLLTTLIESQSFRLDLAAGNKDPLYPGGSSRVGFVLVNEGAEDTFQLTVSDDVGLVTGVSPTSVTLATGTNVTGYVTFSAATSVSPGTASTAILTAQGSSGSSTAPSNFITVPMTVSERIILVIDTSPPVCSITSVVGNCTAELQHPDVCADRAWSVQMSVTDSGLGLREVWADVSTGQVLTTDTFVSGLKDSEISANYSSTCCHPTMTVTVVDLAGYVDQCVVDFSIPTTEAPPTTPRVPTTAAVTTPQVPTTAAVTPAMSVTEHAVAMDVGMTVSEFNDEVKMGFKVTVASSVTSYCQRHVMEFTSCRQENHRRKRAIYDAVTFDSDNVVILEGYPTLSASPDRITVAFFVSNPNSSAEEHVPVPGSLLLMVMRHDRMEIEEALGWRTIYSIYTYGDDIPTVTSAGLESTKVTEGLDKQNDGPASYVLHIVIGVVVAVVAIVVIIVLVVTLRGVRQPSVIKPNFEDDWKVNVDPSTTGHVNRALKSADERMSWSAETQEIPMTETDSPTNW